MEDQEVYANLLQSVFDMIESGKVFGVTSTFVLITVLNQGNSGLINTVK